MARLARRTGPGIARRVDYLDLAQWYRERFGRRGLAHVIRDTFADRPSPPADAGPLPADVPAARHVDHDELRRPAGADPLALKRYPVTVVRPDGRGRDRRGDGVHVVKLHGDARHPDEIVLCRDDYDEFFERRPAMALLLEGLLLNQTFFFLGYGLRDPNFRQVFSRIARMLATRRRRPSPRASRRRVPAARGRAVAAEGAAPGRRAGGRRRRSRSGTCCSSSTGWPTGWPPSPRLFLAPTSRSRPSWAGSER